MRRTELGSPPSALHMSSLQSQWLVSEKVFVHSGEPWPPSSYSETKILLSLETCIKLHLAWCGAGSSASAATSHTQWGFPSSAATATERLAFTVGTFQGKN